MEITILSRDDLDNGFLESLESLRPTGLNSLQALAVYHKLTTRPYVYVAKNGDQVIGAATLLVEQKFIHQGGKVGHIEDVAVHKDHQGKKVGQKLVERMLEDAKKLQCYKVILDCDPSLVGFYEKSGFRQSAVQMRIDLEVVEPNTTDPV